MMPDRPQVQVHAEAAAAPTQRARSSSLVVQRLSKAYATCAGELRVLHDIELELKEGQAAAIMGPSGSGKSTLLHILGGLDRPTAGSVRIDGKDLASLSESELSRFRNAHMGFVFQDHYLLPQCSILENVLIPTLAEGRPDQVRVERARALVDRVGLSHRLTHRPAELSGGERQRVSIARALINRPALLLGDEPTGNLDQRTASAITDLLLDVHRNEGGILLVVTHSRALAGRLDVVLELSEGKLQTSRA